MYEYHTAYKEIYGHKLTYIPFPSESDSNAGAIYDGKRKVRIFIGIQKERSIYKGTDIILRVLERVAAEHPNECEVLKAENVPFEQYSRMVNDCDVLIDQLYGYSPGMNALLAMSKGKIVVGGAEEECYEILEEKTLRPMVNIIPDEEHIHSQLKWIIDNKEKIATMQRESIEFVKKHHLPEKVAQEYIDFWQSR